MLYRLSEHRVIIVAALIGVISQYVLFRIHHTILGILLGAAIVLTVCVVNMPRRLRLWRGTVIVLNGAFIAASAYVTPTASLPALLLAAVVSSFIAVHVGPKWGLAFFFIEGLLIAVPLYIVRNQYDVVLFDVVLSASVVLSLQLYEVASKFRLYRRLSIYDELTHLHNMRYFRHKLDLLYRDPKVKQISLCLLDLDRFKAVNDALGHRVGDQVLTRAARVIQDTARPAVVSRYGGEEFAVLLANTEATEVRDLAERLRTVMADAQVCLIPVTLSCGIAHANFRDRTADELFDAADKALYEAKQTRNRVVEAEDKVWLAEAEAAVAEHRDLELQ